MARQAADAKIQVVLAFLVLGTFWPLVIDVRHHRYTNYDDPTNFVDNGALNPPSGSGLLSSLVSAISWSNGTVIGVYEPAATALKFMICHTIALWHDTDGGCAAAGAAQALLLTSLMLHVINAALSLQVCLRLLDVLNPTKASEKNKDECNARRSAAFVAVAVAACGPSRVEVVAWISCLPYMLAGTCSLLFVLKICDGRDSGLGTLGGHYLTYCYYALACLSKAAAVPVAAVPITLSICVRMRQAVQSDAVPRKASFLRWLITVARYSTVAVLSHVDLLALAVIFSYIAYCATPEHQLGVAQFEGTTLELAWITVVRACYIALLQVIYTLWPLPPVDAIVHYRAHPFNATVTSSDTNTTAAEKVESCLQQAGFDAPIAIHHGWLPISLRRPLPEAPLSAGLGTRLERTITIATICIAVAGIAIARRCYDNWRCRHQPAIASSAAEGLFACSLLLFALISPVCISVHANSLAAERYGYISSLILAPAMTVLVLSMVAPLLRRYMKARTRNSTFSIYPRSILGALLFAYFIAVSSSTRQHIIAWRGSSWLWARALLLAPTDPVSASSLGHALHRGQGRLHAGIACYHASVALAPGRASSLNQLGNALSDAGDRRSAIEVYQRVLELDPHSPHVGDVQYANALDSFGTLYAGMGGETDYARAIQMHRDALRFYPVHKTARVNLGGALVQEATRLTYAGATKAALLMSRDALAHLEAALHAAPRNVATLSNLCVAQQLRDQLNNTASTTVNEVCHQAQVAAEAMVAAQPGDMAALEAAARANLNLGRAAKSANRIKLAEEAFEKAIAAPPGVTSTAVALSAYRMVQADAAAGLGSLVFGKARRPDVTPTEAARFAHAAALRFRQATKFAPHVPALGINLGRVVLEHYRRSRHAGSDSTDDAHTENEVLLAEAIEAYDHAVAALPRLADPGLRGALVHAESSKLGDR